MPKEMSGWPRTTARSPTARSWTSATTIATASWIRSRIDAPEDTRFAPSRAERSGRQFHHLPQRVYTACEACKDDPKKPPKWQVKAMRSSHDENEKMLYFEDASSRSWAFLSPIFRISRRPIDGEAQVGPAGADVQHELGLWRRVSRSPITGRCAGYDATFTPMVTTKQGPLLQR